MAVVPRALGLVAALALLGTASYLAHRYNKKKSVVNIKMDGMDRSSSSSSSKISGKKRRLNSGGEVPKESQLNESLFELYKPKSGVEPTLQILFFHGFQFGDYDNAHISTWESEDEDGTFIWPQTWLSEEFPEARILSVAYNCCPKDSTDSRNADLFILGENLMGDLLAENIGQDRRCPVVLVGHSFGGLVMKKLCLHARDKGSTGSTEHSKFLGNMKGLFFYSTPHKGIRSKTVTSLFESKSLLLRFIDLFRPPQEKKSLLLENVKTLSTSTARLNEDFEELRRFYNWKIAGLGESRRTKLGSYFPFMVVKEASSRYGDYFRIVPGASHITISRPEKRTSTTFTFLTELIRKVSATRKVIHKTHGLPNFSYGLDEHVEDVKKRLEMAASPVKVLKIVGMGGIGKTTIAKQLFNGISSNYEYTCFVDSVKDIPMQNWEDSLLRHFHCDGQSLSKIQWSSLRGKTTLIVMDDVDSENQLRKLPNLDDFGGGSCLIITSQDHNIFTNVAPKFVLSYDVEFLTLDQAKKLLCRHVFDMDTIDMGHQYLANYVDELVQKCQGLPLTLKVTGSYLRHYKHKISIWKGVIKQLEETKPIIGSQNDCIWASLRRRFEDLGQEEKQMFIGAGTCFFEQPLEEALAAWSTPNCCAEMVWKNLISRSLVKVVTRIKKNWEYYEEIWVHEQLRDLAKNISQLRQIRPVFKNTICLIPYRVILNHAILMKVTEMMGDDEGSGADVSFWFNPRVANTDEIRLVEPCLMEPFLSYNDSYKQRPTARLNLKSLEHLKHLKYVYLQNIMPQGFTGNFPRTFSLLKWILDKELGHPQLPEINWKDMYNLGLLHLQGWTIPGEFIEALGTLTNLRILKLDWLKGFDHLPKNIGDLRCLEQLELHSLSLSELPESFAHLSALKQLKVHGLGISQLPGGLNSFTELKTLHIEDCPKLRGSLSESFGVLDSLENLHIQSCRNLRDLPESFGNLRSLKNLHIQSCRDLRGLPESFGNLGSLEKLHIQSCRYLRDLPKSCGGLRSLKKLHIEDCRILRNLPESISDLRPLEILCIDCPLISESFLNLNA